MLFDNKPLSACYLLSFASLSGPRGQKGFPGTIMVENLKPSTTRQNNLVAENNEFWRLSDVSGELVRYAPLPKKKRKEKKSKRKEKGGEISHSREHSHLHPLAKRSLIARETFELLQVKNHPS